VPSTSIYKLTEEARIVKIAAPRGHYLWGEPPDGVRRGVLWRSLQETGELMGTAPPDDRVHIHRRKMHVPDFPA